MKRIFTITLTGAGMALFFTACNDQRSDGFELKGNLSNSAGQTLYLEHLTEQSGIVVDSTELSENGDFEFRNYKPALGFYRVKLDERNFAMLILDSTDKIRLSADAKDIANTYKVEGSDETKLFLEYNDISKKRQLRVDSMQKVFETVMARDPYNKALSDSISKILEVPFTHAEKEFTAAMTEKIGKNTDKYASLIGIQPFKPDEQPDLYRKLDADLTKKYPNHPHVQGLHARVSAMQATTMGQEAPDIKLPDPDGKVISLSSLRGKVVLIDFWASWCGPCRREMPNVVAAYAKYKNKGFEIFGVSLDLERTRWLEAIKADGITWPQVSDLKQWQSSVVPQYNIQGIPYTVLLDREGRIIAKNLRGEELDRKLGEVLN